MGPGSRAHSVSVALLLSCVLGVLQLSTGQLTNFASATLGGNVTICVRNYPPYIMRSDFATMSNGSLASFDMLKNASIDSKNLTGFDYDYISFLFSKEVMNVSSVVPVFYLPCNTELDLYYALLNKACDMAVSSITLDPDRNQCDETCSFFPFSNSTGAAANTSSDAGTTSSSSEGGLNGICCIEYSNPYFLSTYALLSIAQASGTDILGTLTSSEVINALTSVLLAMFIAAWVGLLFEYRTNKGMKSIAANVYWATVTLTTVGYGDVMPQSTSGRALSAIWMMISVIMMCIFESIISAQFTAALVGYSVIDGLADITGRLCVESNRDDLQSFLDNTDAGPSSWDKKALNKCVDGLNDGTYQAILSDRPVLMWVANQYAIQDAYVSRPLADDPQAFAFRADDHMRVVVNPLIIKSKRDKFLLAYSTNLVQSYFPETIASPTAPSAPINWLVIIALIVIAGVSAIVAIVHGIFRRHYEVAVRNAQVSWGENDVASKLAGLVEAARSLQAQAEELQLRGLTFAPAPLQRVQSAAPDAAPDSRLKRAPSLASGGARIPATAVLASDDDRA